MTVIVDSIKELDGDNQGTGTGDSQWVSAKLGDISGLANFLEGLQGIVDTADDTLGSLIDVTNAIISIVEIAKNITSDVGDIQKDIIEFAVNELETVLNFIIDYLENIFEFGLYFLPQFEAFDFGKVIRNEILNPGFDSESLDATDRFIRVPDKEDPSNTHYERVRRRGRLPKTNYEQFIEDIVRSFDDPNDALKPAFEADTELSGVTVAISSDRLAIFLMAYILIDTLCFGQKHALTKIQGLEKELNIAMGRAEVLGRNQTQSIDDIILLKEAMKRALDIDNLTASFQDFLRIFQGLFDRDDEIEEVIPKFVSLSIEGDSENYTVFYDGPENLFPAATGKTEVVGSLEQSAAKVPNFTNFVTLNITTEGSGKLKAYYYFNGESEPLETTVGENQNNWSVGIPLNPVGLATVNSNDPAQQLVYDFDTGSLLDLDGNILSTPTRVVFEFVKLDLSGAEVVGQPDTFSIAIPKFDRLTSVNSQTYRDGYRHNIEFEFELPNTATKNKVANYLGISLKELEQRFPLKARTRFVDLSQFGPDVDSINIKVGVRPQVNINSSFEGRLIANGKVIEATKKRISTSTAELTFTNVPVGNSSSMSLIFNSEQQVTLFVAQNSPDNGNYIAYSSPEYGSITVAGGRLSSPKITSGNKINVTENVFRVNPEKGIVGLSGGQGKNRFNEIFGRGQGSLDTELQNFSAIYRLTGRKSKDAFAYCVVTYPDGTNKMEVLVNPLVDFFPNVAGDATLNAGFDDTARGKTAEFFVGDSSIGLGTNRFSKQIILPWQGVDLKYTITVYQTLDKNDISLINEIKQGRIISAGDDEAAWFKVGGSHKSGSDTVEVIVSNKNIGREPVPPNWATISLEQFIPILDPFKERLNELIDILKESIPAGPYDTIGDWLDVMSDKLGDIVAIFDTLRNIINNINSILQIGGTGFWFLGIDKANGVEGFKQRLLKVEVPYSLENAKNVTGIQILVPSTFPNSDVPAGSTLMNTIFAKLPSKGTDDIEVKEPTSLKEQIQQTRTDTAKSIAQKIEDIGTARTRIREISTEDIKNFSIRAEDLD